MRVSAALESFFSDGWDCDVEREALALLRHLRETVTPSEWKMEWEGATTRQVKARTERDVERAVKQRVRHRGATGSPELHQTVAAAIPVVAASIPTLASESRFASMLTTYMGHQWGESSVRKTLRWMRDHPCYDAKVERWGVKSLASLAPGRVEPEQT